MRPLPSAWLPGTTKVCGHPSQYCRLNLHIPVLVIYFDGESDLRPDFRLSRLTVAHLIQLLRSPLDHGWGHDLEVLVFLFWMASATSYRVVSRAFAIPRSTVHDIIHRVTEKVLRLKNRLIFFPSADQLQTTGAGFERLAGSAAFARVVGSIDGCHIRIKPPSADAQCYFNRKLFHSIQLQAVCDHQCQFLDIFVGYPGSVHDARVLKNSPLYVQKLYPPEGFQILGDGGYPCTSEPLALITPYREPVRNPVEARFNRHHAKARSVVERAFGIMKARWRSIFFKALEVKPQFAVKVIACCAILHNLCQKDGDILEPVEEALGPDDGGDQVQPDLACGERLRGRIAAAVSAPVNNPPALQDHDY
ncbi:putative nuclease HARBI1 [Larimichthys crocea]|uniref:Putative nuclease HARBI1 n=1 Tax=Larimichthys crocea TaxID=215358 RepID=A0A6G0HI38_LARCR|nr:putative nuclease HARBI1 [Larimichthys crocea]